MRVPGHPLEGLWGGPASGTCEGVLEATFSCFGRDKPFDSRSDDSKRRGRQSNNRLLEPHCDIGDNAW